MTEQTLMLVTAALIIAMWGIWYVLGCGR